MSFLRFQKSINGANFTQNGLTSFSKTIRLTKNFNLNLNISKSGIFASVSLPGTGIYSPPICLYKYGNKPNPRSK